MKADLIQSLRDQIDAVAARDSSSLDVAAAYAQHPEFVPLARLGVFSMMRLDDEGDLADVGDWEYDTESESGIHATDDVVVDYANADDAGKAELRRRMWQAWVNAKPLFDADLDDLDDDEVRNEVLSNAYPVFSDGVAAAVAFERIRVRGRERRRYGPRAIRRPRQSRRSRRLTSGSAGGGSSGRPRPPDDDDLGDEPEPPSGGEA